MMSTWPRRAAGARPVVRGLGPRTTTVLVLALAAVLVGSGTGAAGAGTGSTGTAVTTAADMTVVAVTPTVLDDLTDGYATVRLDVALRSTTGLPDELYAVDWTDPTLARARRVEGEGPAWLPGEATVDTLSWETLTRVSGTATDGVWRGDVLVSPVLTGTWVVSGLRDYGGDPSRFVDLTGFDATLELVPSDGPVLAVQPAQAAPLRVVTGTESWTPRARVTERSTGAGVRSGYLDHNFYGSFPPRPREESLPRADAQGYVTLTPTPVVFDDGEYARNYLLAYASRGSRGLSWESATVLWPQVKWQANQRFSVSGRTVTATGNAWPAPDVYPAANPGVNLQHLVGRTWRTVDTAQVRSNGRFTLTWTAPTTGPQVVRVYKPGGTSGYRGLLTSVGTTLSAVTVTTR